MNKPRTIWAGKLEVENAGGVVEDIEFRVVYDGIDLHAEKNVGVDRMGDPIWQDVPHMETQAYLFRRIVLDALTLGEREAEEEALNAEYRDDIHERDIRDYAV